MPAHIASTRSARRLRWDSSVNVVWDGNSLVYGVGATGGQTLPVQVAALAPMAGSGAAVTNCGISGQRWSAMTSGAVDVDGAWQSGKTNVLICWETTNSACNTPGLSAAQIISDITTYIAARRSAHPWVIVGLTTIPRETSGLMTSQAERERLNGIMSEVDAAMKAGQLDFDAVVDVRQPGSAFAFSGYTTADFDGSGWIWAELSPNRVHLLNAGYAIIAGYVADALKRIPRVPH